MKQKHFIDSHKCATGAFVLFCMWQFNAWENTTAWLYLALHGTYGVLWALKSALFGDKQWEQPTSLAYGLVIWGALSLYWSAPYLITSGNLEAPPWLLALCVSLYTIGIFLHFAGDMQKHVHLSLRPGHLFVDGLWSFSRNPNYLGELFIYLGFTALAMHYFPLLALFTMVCAVWLPNMVRKERSLSRYPEFAEWKKKSGIIFPFFP